LALRALEEELGCSISRQVGIKASTGWLTLDGAAAKGEELIAIEIKVVRDSSIALYNIESLLGLLETLKLERFKKSSLVLAIVSDATEEQDAELKKKLAPIIEKSKIPITLRFFRLNLLKARYGL